MSVNNLLFRGISPLAERATQEVFIRLARYAPIETLAVEEDFYSYIRSLCQNVLEDQKLILQRQENVQASVVEEAGPGLLGKRTVPETALKNTLERLSEADRSLAERMLAGYTLRELGGSDAAQRIRNLRARIQKLLPTSALRHER